ncbi:hypothetical protein AAHC03_01201 [Spirometra sp. Aus1]
MASFGVNNFMSSVGISLKPRVAMTTDQYGNAVAFAGVRAPVIGDVGFTLGGGGTVHFGRFQDPRAALRARAQNKVVVPPDSGLSSRKPVPASTGGQVQKQGRSYEELKAKHLAAGTLFEDDEFPAIGSSVFYSQQTAGLFQWKRPTELSASPKFVSDGVSRFDVEQGELGDCWLLAAVANLSMYQDLLYQVVPPDQSFDNEYCGIFRFHFWHFGEWVEVVIDDRLPTRNNRLVFLHSHDQDEYWSALLEKAYAKLFGSYEALKGGSTVEALEDFTGGLAEFYDLRGKQPPDFNRILNHCYEKKSLMACSINADPNVIEARQSNGLIRGHAYSITKIAMVNLPHGQVMLIRIRNPWGNEAEWNGRWSDRSGEWQSVSDQTRRDLGLTFDADGEFWMCYDDFVREFEKLEICHLGPQSLDSGPGSDRITFQMTVEHGTWQPGVNAGGCRNFLDTFWTNPQYRVQVQDADENDNEDKGTLIIGLMQKDRRKMRKQGMELLTIGFMVYALKEEHAGPLDMNFFKYNAAVARSNAFINSREVSGRFRLTPGTYVIVPSTFQKNEQADFVLRIFSEKISTSEQMDVKIGMEEPAPSAVPPALNTAQVEALRQAFIKVSGTDGQITADELVDILNVAFTKELAINPDENAPKPQQQPGTQRSEPKASVKRSPMFLLCCGAPSPEPSQETAGSAHYQSAATDDFAFEGFSLESCRSLIAMMDVDRSGTLDFEEFKTLWEILRHWKATFKKFDADKNGTMSSFELRNALKFVGYNINNATFGSLVLRFANREQILHFDDYIICCARLRTAFECLKAKEANAFTSDELLNMLIYL